MSVPAVQPGLALVDDGEVRARRIDHEPLECAVGDMLRALGADTAADGLRETRRVAEAYAELLTPPSFRATTFPNENGYDGGDAVPLALHASPAALPRARAGSRAHYSELRGGRNDR